MCKAPKGWGLGRGIPPQYRGVCDYVPVKFFSLCFYIFTKAAVGALKALLSRRRALCFQSVFIVHACSWQIKWLTDRLVLTLKFIHSVHLFVCSDNSFTTALHLTTYEQDRQG